MRIFATFLTGSVIGTSWKVSQRSSGANYSIDIAPGGGLVQGSSFPYAPWSTAVVNKSVNTPSATLPRIDFVVGYLDMTIPTQASQNGLGAWKFLVVTGTAASSPSAPTDAAIQSAVGSGNPWTKLARIDVGTPGSYTQPPAITDSMIVDLRKPLAFNGRLIGGTSNTSGHIVPNIADGTVHVSSDVNGIVAKNLSQSAIKLGRTANTTTAVLTAGTETTIASITVNIPDGGRDVTIEGFIGNLVDSGAGGATIGTFRIYKNGVELQRVIQKWQGSDQQSVFISAEDIAPSKTDGVTYSLTGLCNPSNLQYNVGAARPAVLKAYLT